MINRIRANHYNLNESLRKKEYIESDANVERRKKMLTMYCLHVKKHVEKVIQEKDWKKLKIVEQYFKKIRKQI